MKQKSLLLQTTAFALSLLFSAFIIQSCKDDETTPAPVINSFSPISGIEGTSVVISGANFSTTLSDNVILFDKQTAEVTAATKTELTVVVPNKALTGKINVSVKGVDVTSEHNFIVTSSTELIGQSGGAVTGSDGKVSLNLPAGALAANTTVSIQQTEEVAPDGIGKVYTLTPEGTTFSKPVKLSFQYTDADAALVDPASMAIGYKKEDDTWEVMPTVVLDAATKTITTETTHFSKWALVKVPAITSFTPSTGAVGTTVTITGTNFSAIAGSNHVMFGTTVAIVFSSTNTQIVATVPFAAVTGQISVNVKGSTYTAYSTTNFTVPGSTPGIASIAPSSGTVGTIITITCDHISSTLSDNAVFFNGKSAPILSFTTSGTTSVITAAVPADVTTGKITVKSVANSVDFIITFPADFTVLPDAPTITSFTPASGLPGTTVTITGTNFSGNASDIVTLNGSVVTPTFTSTTQITFLVPTFATTGKIALTKTAGNLSWIATSATNFVVLKNEPSISSFTPGSGTPGTLVTITGKNFSSKFSDNTVLFNGQAASIIALSTTQIVATVPAGATTGKITVMTIFNSISYTLSSATDFIVESNEPVMTSFAPSSGTAGTVVTITGKNFSSVPSDNQVSFNGLQATVTSSSSTQLVAIVPAGATTGKIMVGTKYNTFNWTLASATDFIIETNEPVMTSFTPSSGTIGTVVTITGKNFSTVPSENKVFFNNQRATVTSSSTTQLVAVVPAGATTGKIMIQTMYGTLSWTIMSATDFTID